MEKQLAGLMSSPSRMSLCGGNADHAGLVEVLFSSSGVCIGLRLERTGGPMQVEALRVFLDVFC